jgi:hypothetical protein
MACIEDILQTELQELIEEQQTNVDAEQKQKPETGAGDATTVRSRTGRVVRVPERYCDEDYARLMLEDVPPEDQEYLQMKFMKDK